MSLNTDALETRYQSLLTQYRKRQRIFNLSRILVLLIMVSLVGMTYVVSIIKVDARYGLILPTIIAVVTALILSRGNKYIMKKDDYVFFSMYDLYKNLKSFSYSKTDDSFKSSVRRIKRLSVNVGSWTTNAPEAISRLPNSISNNLTSKLLPLLNEEHAQGGKLQTINSFNDVMFNVILSVSQAGLTMQSLERLNEILEQLPPSTLLPAIKKEKIYSKYPVIKFIWIPILCGIILFYTFNSIDPKQLHATLGYTLGISSAVLLGVIQLTRRNQSS